MLEAELAERKYYTHLHLHLQFPNNLSALSKYFNLFYFYYYMSECKSIDKEKKQLDATVQI